MAGHHISTELISTMGQRRVLAVSVRPWQDGAAVDTPPLPMIASGKPQVEEGYLWDHPAYRPIRAVEDQARLPIWT